MIILGKYWKFSRSRKLSMWTNFSLLLACFVLAGFLWDEDKLLSESETGNPREACADRELTVCCGVMGSERPGWSGMGEGSFRESSCYNGVVLSWWGGSDLPPNWAMTDSKSRPL